MRRITLSTAVALALAVALLTPAATAMAAHVAKSAATAPASAASTVTTTAPAGGIEVGPPLSPAPAAPKGQVKAGQGEEHPFFLDIPGQIKKAINDWFRGLVEDALNPALALVGKTVLATPQVATLGRVTQLWQIALGIADALLVLFVIAGGFIVMSHETVQSRHALKDILPRLTLGALAANASLALSRSPTRSRPV